MNIILTSMFAICMPYSFTKVERLLRWGADPTRVNDRGRTPLDVACEFGRALVSRRNTSLPHCSVNKITTMVAF